MQTTQACRKDVNQRDTAAVVGQKPTGYNVHTSDDILSMLDAMGLRSLDTLFSDIPAQVRLKRPLSLPPALSEWELQRDVRSMGRLNATAESHLSFLGAGAYEHHVPAVVDAIVSRGEFLTAYTPYQPEMSQGLLQALFEFQTLAGRLLGRECVNCSVYDGATALAESCWMMCASSGQRKILAAETVFEEYRAVMETYLEPRGVEIEWIASDNHTGLLQLETLRARLALGGCAGVVLQTPNAFGVIEDVAALAQECKQAGALLCVSVNPMLCGWVQAPGTLGADIVCCEGQPLGLHLSAGGPYVGIIACAKPLERYLPGRLVGRVHDLNGKLGYALVKEDREQHVARDKATSHICSNQALNAIRVALYLSSLGEANFMRLAEENAAAAASLRDRLTGLPGVSLLRSGTHFNEFAVQLPLPSEAFCRSMSAVGIFAGVPVPQVLAGHDRGLLVAVTETKTAADLDRYVAQAAASLKGGA